MKKKSYFDKQYLGRVALYVAATALAVGAVFYIGFHLSADLKSGLVTEFAVKLRSPENLVCDAYVLRDEEVIPTAGLSVSPTPSVRDGEKVRAGNVVAEEYSGTSAGTKAKIELLEDQIEFFRKCATQHVSIGDTSLVDRSIADSVIDIRRAADYGKLERAAAYKRSMLLDIRRLGVMTGSITDFEGQISSLEAEIDSLKAGLGTRLAAVSSPCAGYYFSECDGYEGVLSSAMIDSLTFSELDGMIKSAASTDAVPGEVDAGKIVKSFKWYIACPMTAAEAARFDEGREYTVTLKNNETSPVEAELYKVLSNSADSIALFECTRMPDDFDYTRLQEATVTVREDECFRLPAGAARFKDDREGVFVLDHSVVEFRRVDVLREDDGYIICSVTDPSEDESEESPFLKENDVVVVGGTGLYEGMIYDPKK